MYYKTTLQFSNAEAIYPIDPLLINGAVYNDDMSMVYFIVDTPIDSDLAIEISRDEYENFRDHTIDRYIRGILEKNKGDKLLSIKEACTNSIFNGFIASNGNEYGFNELDQANFTQQTILILSGDTRPIRWKTRNNGVVEHTVGEFQAVINDAAAHKLAQQEKYWALETQILSATTVEEIEAVVW